RAAHAVAGPRGPLLPPPGRRGHDHRVVLRVAHHGHLEGRRVPARDGDVPDVEVTHARPHDRTSSRACFSRMCTETGPRTDAGPAVPQVTGRAGGGRGGRGPARRAWSRGGWRGRPAPTPPAGRGPRGG